MAELIYPEESHRIMGAAFQVYKDKGCGFLEPVYQECMEAELEWQGIPFAAQPELHLQYRGKTLKKTYQPDLVCFGGIIVELKAVEMLADEHRAQLLNYLHATKFRLGILLNFGHYPKVEYLRMVL